MEGSETRRSQGEKVSLYQIDGVIANEQELAQFRMQPIAEVPGAVTEKTVTTYRTAPPAVSGGYPVPGGTPATLYRLLGSG